MKKIILHFIFILLYFSILFYSTSLFAQAKAGYEWEKEKINLTISSCENGCDMLTLKLNKKLSDRYVVIEYESVKKSINILSFKVSTSSSEGKWSAEVIAKILLSDNELGETREVKLDGSSLFSFSNKGYGSTETEAIDSAVDDAVDNIFKAIVQFFPLRANLMRKEGNIAILDLPKKANFKIGTRFDVIKENKKVGLIEVYEILDDYTKANIKRGKSKIRVGNICEERLPFVGSLALSHTRFPIEIDVNKEYESLSGKKSEPLGNTGTFTKLSIDYISPKWKLSPGLGWLDLQLTRSLHLDFNGLLSEEIIPELIELNLGGGGGIGVSFSEQNWMRPQGDYNDLAGDSTSGKAGANFLYNYQVFGGIETQCCEISNKKLTLFSNLGYFSYNYGSKWEDNDFKEEIGDKTEYFGVKDEWLQYKVKNTSGVGFQIGLSIRYH